MIAIDSISRSSKKLGRHALLIIICAFMAFPFYWMIISALKTKEEVWKFPPSFVPEVAQWNHFIEAWNAAPFGLYIFNSLFTASVIVFIQLINSAMIGYAFTQLKFRGRDLLFYLILGTYMLPSAVTYVPSYILLGKMGLLNSYEGIIVSNAVNVFGIFLLRIAFLQVPREVIEAAKIDGASHWFILWKIMLPLAKTSFITFGLISFVQMYNNYLWPSLIVNSEQYYLVNVGLRQFFIQGGAYGIEWPLVMAASTFAVLPLLILFLIAQKWFVRGISDRGVKG